MKRLMPFILVLVIWALTIRVTNTPSIAAPVKPKYNVLFIIADDLRPDLGC